MPSASSSSSREMPREGANPRRAGREFVAVNSPLELLPPAGGLRRNASSGGVARKIRQSSRATASAAGRALFRDGLIRLKQIGKKAEIGFSAGSQPGGQPIGEIPKAAKVGSQEKPEKPLKPATLALSVPPPKKIKPSELEGFIFGGVAPMIAVIFTNPADVVKTRMQLQGELMRKGEGKMYNNVFDCLVKTAKYDGLGGLQKGLKAMFVRELVINSLRLGTFEPILHRIHDHDFGPAPIWKKLIAGGIAGMLGSFAANPIELVKTRLQSRASSAIAVGNQFEYAGPIDAALSIIRENGITGMWKGATAGMLRATLGNAVMMSTYSTLREYLLHERKLPQSHELNIGTSLVAGFVSSLAMNPVDVVRTRMYNQKYVNGKPQTYFNIPDAVVKIAATEGPTAFLKGFSSNYLFRGPQIVLTFNIIEAFKHHTNAAKRAALQGEGVPALLAALDADRDGLVSEADLLALARRAHADEPAARAAVDAVLAAAGARELDAAGLERARGPAFALARRAGEAAAFRALDRDGDGLLSEADVAAGVRALAPGGGAEHAELVAKAARKAVAHADRYGDGRVSPADFGRLFEDYELHGRASERTLLAAWLKDASVRVQ